MDRCNRTGARVPNRNLRLAGIAVALVASSGLLALQTGCVNALAAAAYIIRGQTVSAEFPGLKNKKVAVVCRPLAQLEYSAGNASEDLARQVGMLLKQNIRGIKIVDPELVAEWSDEHNWSEYTEIGEALNADVVLGLDLRDFGLYQGMTLYQGRAKVALAVYDMRDEGKILYQRSLPQVVYPPNSGIPTSEKPDDEFRRQYIGVLADEIGKHFYDHDGMADFARDATAMR
ncbi:MAG TPA: hypothetical protein VG713_01640 [Pirellulales bacterium]|nr:hypothetical protein [Pirellulales bacterium]